MLPYLHIQQRSSQPSLQLSFTITTPAGKICIDGTLLNVRQIRHQLTGMYIHTTSFMNHEYTRKIKLRKGPISTIQDACRKKPDSFATSCIYLSISHIIIIIIIIISSISLLCWVSTHTYISETNHVPREHCVATILMLLFMVLISLVAALTPMYLYVSTFRSMCAVPNMAVFCSSLTS